MTPPTTTLPKPNSTVVPPLVHIAPADYVTVALAAQLIGLSEKSIRRRIEEGTWLEGRQYRRALDGRIYVSIKEFASWVEKG